MAPLILFVKIGVYAAMAVTLLAAFAAVNLPNIFHAALALTLALVGVAVVFLALGAEFLAAVQVLLYVGAIITLMIFAIMLTQALGKNVAPQKNRLKIIAGILSFVFFLILCQVLRPIAWPFHSQTMSARISTADIGAALLGHFVFPFEVISVILLAALVGAVIIAKKDPES